MMPGSKGLSPHELARKWVKDLMTPTSNIFYKQKTVPKPTCSSTVFPNSCNYFISVYILILSTICYCISDLYRSIFQNAAL